MADKKMFMTCSKCGKRLIERMPNGLWRFIFGRAAETPDEPPVYMIIHGSLMMKCLRRSCRHENTFNFLPIKDMDLSRGIENAKL